MSRAGSTGLVMRVAVLLAVLIPAAAHAQVGRLVTRADYARADSFGQRTRGLVVGVAESPEWIGAGNRFWYRVTVEGGHRFVLVSPEAGTKEPAFDHERLATALTAARGGSVEATGLPFDEFEYVNARGTESAEPAEAADSAEDVRVLDETEVIEDVEAMNEADDAGEAGAPELNARFAPVAIEFVVADSTWRCDLVEYACQNRGARERRGEWGGGGRDWPWQAGPGQLWRVEENEPLRSPDGRLEALIRNYNVFVREAGAEEPVLESFDGSEGDQYTRASMAWSPDSRRLAVYRVVPGYQREIHYVRSSPEDQLQPEHSTLLYAKPGDVLDHQTPVIFDVGSGDRLEVADDLFPNPFTLSGLQWREDSERLTFEYNQRGHEVFRIIEVDATSGATRAVVSEEPETFFDYAGKRFRRDVDDGDEVIWMSERDGWNHLYLYDGRTGRVKNQITRGEWVVRGVDTVDVANRRIWFTASGMNEDQDPYFVHQYSIGFDGRGLTAYTEANGTHDVSFSPDRAYYVDRWSRVDQPPVAMLRRTSDRSVVTELERADASALLATGWRYPEVFVAKGRDGETDIWGIIVRPTDFDSTKSYPVVESIYAGPHSSFVPKSFSTQARYHALAELGFIVVQMDGMGTSNRSKAFHDVAWKNIKDAGFPDRILWHQAAAERYPYYDTSRVGIYGGSAGGQNAMGALLFHPEFYGVAVSASGCHDNRMDKIWWNELWMSWPIGPHYAESSNVVNAHRLEGKLLLILPEMDTNVDPSSTLQVVDALIEAGKDFDFLMVPNFDHGFGGDYGIRKRNDFFVENLLGVEPPNWNGGGDSLRSAGADR